MRSSIIRFGVLGVYLGLILFSLFVLIKPGASIFYYQKDLSPDQIAPDAGYAYRFPLRVDPTIYSPQGVLLEENGQKLLNDPPNLLVEQGQGRFFLTDPVEGGYYLYFSSSDNSDPRTNGYLYTIFFPVFFFSRPMGFLYLGILALPLGKFIFFGLRSSPSLWAKPFSLARFTSTMDDFIRVEIFGSLYSLTNRLVTSTGRNRIWRQLLYWTVLAAFVYTGMEWLFFITKPSFMELYTLGEKITLLLQTGLFVGLPNLAFVALLWGVDTWLPLIKKIGLLLLVATLIPVALFSGLALLLVDNFTYTLFRFGVASSAGLGRVAYATLFVIGYIKLYQLLLLTLGLRGAATQPTQLPRWQAATLGGLLVLSLATALARFDFDSIAVAQDQPVGSHAQFRPNIILMGSDGLDSTNLSAYGYERDTTPTMRVLAEKSLVAENAFSNAAVSTGSVISIFSSKLPTQTRVLFPPDILQGLDSYQHLPGILKREGYTTVEIGVDHFVDAYQTNLLNGFDRVNGRSLGTDGWMQTLQGRGYDDVVYFSLLLWDRISERLEHIFFIKPMTNPFLEVTNPTGDLVDEDRVKELLDLIANSNKPFFAHVHMMGTHGGKFHTVIEQFSAGKTQDKNFMVDFYDDSILSFDAYLAAVLDALEQAGKMDETILIIYSDHGQIWITYKRIPLIIRFPHDQYAGRIWSNVQNLDIAPTILDYLGLPIPDWIEGQSLLYGDPSPERLIFASGTDSAVENNTIMVEKLTPPFYQFTYFNVVQCDRWYQYDVPSDGWTSGKVEGHTAPCNPESLLSMEAIQEALVDQLVKDGFDVSSLR